MKQEINEQQWLFKQQSAPEQIANYIIRPPKSPRQQAKETGQDDDFVRAGIEKALADRASSFYGAEGVQRGFWGGLGAGVLAALSGKRFRGGLRNITKPSAWTKKVPKVDRRTGQVVRGPAIRRYDVDPSKVGARTETVVPGDPVMQTALGSAAEKIVHGGIGGLVGGGAGAIAGLIDPETGMALPVAATALGAGMLGGRAYRGLKRRKAIKTAIQNPMMRGRRYEPGPSRGQADIVSGGAAASIAAVVSGSYYDWQSDRFERSKRGEADPYFGAPQTTPGFAPGY